MNQLTRKTLGLALGMAAPLAVPALLGCDMGAIAVGTTVGVMQRAAPGVQRMRDPEILEAAFPGSLQQSEGLLEIKPDDPTLRSMTARSYASFAFAFLEDHYEAAQRSDDATEEEIEHWRVRTSLAYQRGREVAIDGLDRLYPQGGGLMAVQHSGLEAWTQYLTHFTDPNTQAPLLFWAAYNWARYIGLHRDDIGAIADLPYVIALSDRAFALDPTYMDHACRVLHGALMAAAPPSLGGRPADARAEIDQVLELTHRRNLTYLVLEAQMVAVPLQDRALYQSLLEEVLAFDIDSYPDQRIPNLIAQRRARRYLDQVDDLFAPADEAPAEGDAAPTE